MQLNIKTLSGETFQILVEATNTVLELKQLIQTSHGHDPLMQKLILTGKILEDSKTLAEYPLEEGATLVIMVSKPKPPPRNAQPAPAQPAPAQLATVQAADTESPAVPTEAASALLTGEPLDAMVCQIMEMGFPRDQVVAALQAAYNNPERAIEYLMNGLPELPQAHPANPLGFLANNPSFQQIRGILQENPAMLNSLLEQLRQENPNLAAQIENNPEAFMQLLEQPAPEINTGLVEGLPRTETQPLPLQLSREEAECVRRLAELGFHPRDALEAFLSCERSEEAAANLLFENYPPLGLPGDEEVPGEEEEEEEEEAGS